MFEYKFFGNFKIDKDRQYQLGGVTQDEQGIYGNGYYAILFYNRTLRSSISISHCEVYKVTTERNLVREELVDISLNWYGAENY